MTAKSGFLIINKPAGPTSHDIIDDLRKITGIKKIGHAGTLDPFASGVLIVAVGREATKRMGESVKLDKKYVAILRLGAVSDTHDKTGKISDFNSDENKQGSRARRAGKEGCLGRGRPDSCRDAPAPDTPLSRRALRVNNDEIKRVLKNFVGKQEQVPPMFSAKKVGGKKLYELARRGIEVERKPVSIEIYDIELLKYEWPKLEIAVHCSSGTYIRTLGHDIGQALGCGAYAEELKRTAVGDFKIAEAISAEALKRGGWEKYLK